jgi:tetratricopeptide (TPR) repeat protein
MSSWIRIAVAWSATGLFVAMTGTGCGTTDNAQQQPVDPERIDRLKARIAQDPGDGAALRDLGEMYLRAGRFVEGYETLKDAFARIPEDPKTRFYLGLAAESVGKRGSARDLFRRYADAPDASPYRRLMRGRSLWLERAAFRRHVRGILAGDGWRERPVARRTVAVLPFACGSAPSRSGASSAASSETGLLAPALGRGAAALLARNLQVVRGLRVVEPARVRLLLRETGRQRAAPSDPASVPYVGPLLGAGPVVGGRCRSLDGEMSLRVRVRTSTRSRLSGIADRQGPPDRLASLLSRVAIDIATAIGASLTPAERDAINRTSAVRLAAIRAYGRGLTAEDRGHFDRAVSQYRRARSLDPSLQAPDRALERARSLRRAAGSWKAVLRRTARGGSARPGR